MGLNATNKETQRALAAIQRDKDTFAALRKDAERYRKLRGWMSSNVPEGWQQVEELASIACWVDWKSFDATLDALPDCNVGLMSKAVGAA